MNAAWDQSDAVLIQRWQHGDTAAFEALVNRWQQPMARFLARLTGKPEQVADLCQELFLRVLVAGPRYRENGSFSTWLYQIALNLARDAGRRQRHEPVPLDGREPNARDIAPEAACQQRELADAVAAALADLSPALREVLVLRHYEGMAFEQMARLLGVPASTLKSRFAATLTRLRERLQPWHDTNEED